MTALLKNLKKILTSPVRTVKREIEAASNRSLWRSREEIYHNDAHTALLVGFADWKTYMLEYLEGANIVVLSHSPNLSLETLASISVYPNPHVYTWSYKFNPDLELYCRRNNIPLTFVEDGFIRSIGLGAHRTFPVSLTFDIKAMHFDRLKSSELESLLLNYDFDADPILMEWTQRLKNLIVNGGLSKYMLAGKRKMSEVMTPMKSRVLVLGQVEDDMSVKYGSERPYSGNQLAELALHENPNAQILYRPHPESLAINKPHYSNPQMVTDFCTLLPPSVSLKESIEYCDTVYTITSLAGFEAALHGKRVVTIGAPFYSGWGFTEDRLHTGRRDRKLSTMEVLAAAYIKYPRYAGIPEQCNNKPKRVVEIAEGLLDRSSIAH